MLVHWPGSVKVKPRVRVWPLADLMTDYVSKLVGLLVDFFLVLAFDHHASEVLSAGVAHQQSPTTVHLALDPFDPGFDFRDRVKRRLALDVDVHEDLRIPLQL